MKYLLELVLYKAYVDLRAESSRGYLGILWWIIEPVMYMAAFYVVFTAIRMRGDVDFVVFLLTGLVVWKWFASTLMLGANSISVNTGLMMQVYLPKYIFPLVAIAINLFKFLIVFLLLLAFLLAYGIHIEISWIALPLLILVQLLLITGVSMLFAAILPFVLDLKPLLENMILMLFFLSGVIFDIHHAPESIQAYLYLNPMVTIIESYRNILLYGIMPDWEMLAIISLLSLTAIIIAFGMLKYFDKTYAKYLIR
jgi:lipopolysaccharide transport system permease protein